MPGIIYLPWLPAESRVVDRFARAIVSGRYRNVARALPECQRELKRVRPDLRRTDTAAAWRLLCRAYDFGLPRRKHFWTDPESRLLKRYALALMRGEYPKTMTAVCEYKRACERAGLGARHSDKVIGARIIFLARAMGGEPVPLPFGPEELRVVAGFSRALARNEYPYGKAAVADCLQALARVGLAHRRSEARLAALINAGAWKLGWQGKFMKWSAPGHRIIEQFARKLAAGRYPSIAAATRACQESLKRAGHFGTRSEAGLTRKLRAQALRLGLPQSRPRWKPDELRVVDRFARACIQGRYADATAAAAACRRALERTGSPVHPGRKAVTMRVLQRVRELR